MGLFDSIFGGGGAPSTDSEDAAMQKAYEDYLKAIEDYQETGFTPYESVGPYNFEQLDSLPQLGPTAFRDIEVDPTYRNAELDALRALEDQAANGLTMRDKADMALLDGDVDRRHAGRVGAIKQDMAARGISGSGLDLVAQQQAAQDATTREALAALEKGAQASERRTQGAIQAGQMAGRMGNEDYSRQARAAQAQDAISRFNAANSVKRNLYNNQGVNKANLTNFANDQDTANRNTAGRNQFGQNVLGAREGAAQIGYNKAADSANRKLSAYQADKQADNSLLGGLIAGGATIAAASDERVKEDIKPERHEDIEIFLDAIKPKQYRYVDSPDVKHGVVVQDLEGTELGNNMVKDIGGIKGIGVNEAISTLLEAVAYLNDKIESK